MNFQNGLLHLSTMTLSPHDPKVLSTIQLPCNWKPNTPAPVFDEYLKTLTDGDPGITQLLMEFIGACLSNVKGHRMKKALFMVGDGNTGKSQVRSLVEKLLGKGNYANIDLRTIEARFGTGVIYGTRLAGTADMSFLTIDELKTFNETSMKDIPHREVEDLSLTYGLYFDQADNESIATVRVSDQMLEQWGVTEQELYDAAVKNTKELLPTKVESMQSVLSGLIGSSADVFDSGLDMYVITNEKKVNGAASVFCDTEALDGLCDKLGGSMYLIPSSIHEFIALPEGKDGGLSGKAAEFASMIKEVNATTLIPEEILGTEPYHYDKENGFEFAERYEQRLKELSDEKEAEVGNMRFTISKADIDGKPDAANEEPEVAVPAGLHM